MNKKTLRIAGWALGLSMAVVGAVGFLNSNAIGHGEFNMVQASSGVELSISDYASAHTWTNGTAYTSVVYDTNITLTGASGGNNSKYYSSNHSWRFYEGDSGTITITAANNSTLTSATFTFANGNSGCLIFDDTNYATGDEISLSGDTAVIGVGHSSGTKNGNVQITNIVITYEAEAPAQSVGISYTGATTFVYDGTNEQTISLAADPDGFTAADGDLLYEWTSDNEDALVPTTDDETTGVFVIKGIGVAKVKVYATDGNSEEATSDYLTFTINKPANEALYSVEIVKGGGAVTSYYSDDEEVDTTDLTLNAVYKSSTYPAYSRTVTGIAANASGVVWTLDIANEKVKVAYTVSETTKNDEFAITVLAAPLSATWDADDHDDVGDDVTITVSPINFAYSIGTNDKSNSPAYNSTRHDTRLYDGNTLTITGNSSVQTIDKIVVTIGYTGDSKGTDLKSTGVNAGGSYTQKDWTFTFTNTTSVVFTGGSNQFRFASMKVYYTEVPPADKDVESVELDRSSASLEVGKTLELIPTVLPADARDISVTWESSDPLVATVANGVVTAVGVGSATITATSVDQDSISDTCVITVTPAPLVSMTPAAAIGDSDTPSETLKLGGNYYDLSVSGGSNRGFESSGSARGAQFSSSKTAVTVNLKTTDLAVATKDLRVVLNASRNANGEATAAVKAGDVSLKCNANATATLTTTAAEYEFTFDGDESAVANPNGLITITLANSGGAVYLKYLKIYSVAKYSNLGNLVNKLHMDDYNEEIVDGEPVYLNYCNDKEHDYYGKTTETGAKYAFNSLTTAQKNLFTSAPEYASAYARLLAWANANGDELNDNVLEAKGVYTSVFKPQLSDNNLPLILTIVSAGTVAVGGALILARKRRNEE